VEQTEEGNLVEVLKEIQASGKVRWIGTSTPPHITKYIESGVFDSFQIPYSALEREHENKITIKGVLKKWAKAGVATKADIEEYKHAFREQQQKKQRKQQQSQKEDKLPEAVQKQMERQQQQEHQKEQRQNEKEAESLAEKRARIQAKLKLMRQTLAESKGIYNGQQA
jgi:aryl-alcohol dehydrogenase-like predicted oxidoreductase